MSIAQDAPVDLLNILADSEDDFDVDLMACGCRLAAGGKINLTFDDIVRLYQFDRDDLVRLLGALYDQGEIDDQVVFDLADQVAKGEVKEPESEFVRYKEERRGKT